MRPVTGSPLTIGEAALGRGMVVTEEAEGGSRAACPGRLGEG